MQKDGPNVISRNRASWLSKALGQQSGTIGQMEKLHDTVVGIPSNLEQAAKCFETYIQIGQVRSAIHLEQDTIRQKSKACCIKTI